MGTGPPAPHIGAGLPQACRSLFLTTVSPYYARFSKLNEHRRDNPGEDLVDPHGRGPAFWFERMDEPRPDGGGAIHIAIWVPYEQAEARIAAALAAGGRMVRDEFAPSWWTLADAAGNEADIATAKGRD
jgi:4a-hydroxytetrahydrobiopterin dehydratase